MVHLVTLLWELESFQMPNSIINWLDEVAHYFGNHVHQIWLFWISFYEEMGKVMLIQRNIDL